MGHVSDDIYYYYASLDWANGKYDLTEHYRPLLYWMYSLTFKVFGITDYGIKVLNVLTDILNIYLIYLISYNFTKSRFFSLVSSLLYGSLPVFAVLSRTELAQTLSVFPVLLSVFFLQRYRSSRHNTNKFIFLALSGICVSAAGNVHPDLFTLGLPFVLAIFLGCLNDQGIMSKQSYLQGTRDVCVFLLGYFLVWCFVFAVFGVDNVMASFLSQKDMIESKLSLLDRFTRIHRLSFQVGIPGLIIYSFYFSLVAYMFRSIMSRKFEFNQLFILMTVYVYIALSGLLFPRFFVNAGRLFIPFIGIVVVFTLYNLYFYLKTFGTTWGRTGFIIVVLVFAINSRLYPHTRTSSFLGEFCSPGVVLTNNLFLTFKQKPNIYRELHDLLKNKVNSRQRLLVGPANFFTQRVLTPDEPNYPEAIKILKDIKFGNTNRRSFKHPAYFGDLADYLVFMKHNNFLDLIKDRRIKYIFVSKIKVFSLMRKTLDWQYAARHFYGLDPKAVNPKFDETAYFINMVKDLGGKIIYDSPHGTIFEI